MAEVVERYELAERPSDVSLSRHILREPVDVQVECPPEQLQAMLDRVAENWRAFGEDEPFWSVLTNPVYERDRFDANREHFFAHGRFDVRRFLAIAARAGKTRFGRAMDFGCGTGRLTVALCEHAASVVGVDISAPHLAQARKYAPDAQFVRIARVDDLDDLGSFDLIVSHIVLQHNPPPVMAAIFRKLLDHLAQGGIAIVQMPTFIPGQSFSADTYLASDAPKMEMNALPMRDVFRIIQEAGCTPVEVIEGAETGDIDGLSHTFAVIR